MDINNQMIDDSYNFPYPYHTEPLLAIELASKALWLENHIGKRGFVWDAMRISTPHDPIYEYYFKKQGDMIEFLLTWA